MAINENSNREINKADITLDKSKLNELSQMSDDGFAQIVYTAMIRSGWSDARARSAASIAPLIKKKLKSASNEDIAKIESIIGKQQLSEILSDKNKEDKK